MAQSLKSLIKGVINRLLLAALLPGLLFTPLPGSGDEGFNTARPSDNMRPLYWSCVHGMCEPTHEPGRDGDNRILLGHIKESFEPGTAPLYWACAYLIHRQGCGRRKLVAQARYDDSLLLGYIEVEPRPGTIPLYWSCRQRDFFGECVELAPDNRGGAASDSALLGYVYVATAQTRQALD